MGIPNGFKHSEESRKKISLAGIDRFKDIKFSAEEVKRRKGVRDKKYRDNLSFEKKEEYRKRKNEHDKANRDAVNEYKKAWYRNMSPEMRVKALEYRRKYNAEYIKNIPDLVIKNRNEYYGKNRKVICEKLSERRRKDPLFKLAATYRVRTRKFLKKYSNAKKSREILGCDWEKLREYLESMFKDGMTWENHGQWHIDHIKPLSKAKDEVDLLRRCHYTNLQPLWALDNMRKSDKY